MVTFSYLDSRVYADDEPLSTAILKRNRANLQAYLDQRPHTGTWVPGAYDTSTGALLSPEISCYAGIGWASIPLLWWVRSRDQTLTIEVEHTCYTTATASPYTSELTMGAGVQTRASFEAGHRIAYTDTESITGNASSSVTTTFTLDVSELPEGWAVVRVGVKSGEGSAVEIQDSGGSGPNCLTGHYGGYHILATAAVADSIMSAGTQVTPLAVKVLDTGGKASANMGANAAQVLHILDNGASAGANRYYVFVYPAITTTAAPDASNDSLWRIDLGATRIGSITLTVTDPGDLSPAGATTDATQAASVSNLQPEVTEAVGVWLGSPKVHALGPRPDIGASDFTGTGPANRIGTSVTLAPTYQPLGWAPVGDDDAFQRRDSAGSATAYVKTAVEVAALVLVTLPTDASAGPFRWELDFKLSFTDLDGSSNAVEVEFEEELYVVASPASPLLSYNTREFSQLARLAAFPASNDDPPDIERSAFAGCFPDGLLRGERSGLRILTYRAVDTSTSTERTLALSVKSDGGSAYTDASGAVAEYRPRVHLLSWTVIGAPFGEREPSIAELGVAT